MTELDLAADVVTLTADLCDRESVSGGEQGLADAIEAALRRLDHLDGDPRRQHGGRAHRARPRPSG